MKKKSREYVSPEDFVKAWQRAGSLSDVAKALSLSYVHTSRRATGYRKAGVPLKRFVSTGRPKSTADEWKALARLAEKEARAS